jgi:hypothetical protein
MVVAARGDKRGLRTHPLHELEAEHAAVKIQRTREVRDLEVNMADADRGINGDGHGESHLIQKLDTEITRSIF